MDELRESPSEVVENQNQRVNLLRADIVRTTRRLIAQDSAQLREELKLLLELEASQTLRLHELLSLAARAEATDELTRPEARVSP